jgi:hypothetical protein
MRGGGERERVFEFMARRTKNEKWAGVKHVEKMIL